MGQTDAEGNQQDFAFDGYFNRTGVTDANDNPTYYERNQYGYTTAITDALDHTTVFTYDSNNNLTEMEDDRSVVTRYEYDGNRLITATVNYQDGVFNANAPDEDVQAVYAYNARGQVTSVKDPRGKTTYYGYDSLGQRTVITDALGNTTRFEYDGLGRVVTTTDALDKKTINAYDAADNLVQVTENYLSGQPQNYQDEYNLVTGYEYDAAGRRVFITDTLAHVTRNQYDAAGRLITTTVNFIDGVFSAANPDQDLITSYEYDTDGRLIKTIERRGAETRTTLTEYGDLGRVMTSTVNHTGNGIYSSADPDANIVTEYAYDAAGNVTDTTDTLGRKTHTEYDALNRPITVTVNYVDGVFNSLYPDEDVQTVYVYDAVGNQSQITNPKSQITQYDYDDLNRVITVTDALDGETAYSYGCIGVSRGRTLKFGDTDMG